MTLPIFDFAMTEELEFILGLGGAVAAALIGGAIAIRLRQPAIVGYLLAGVLIGPFTPGFVGDVEQISALAEVGVILLLFALGVEFSIRELRDVGRVALPGGIVQIALIAATGMALMVGLGSGWGGAFVVGACLSISSTLVVLKSLLDSGEIDSLHGRVAIGWSIVQDVATIVFIVALPSLVGGDAILPLALALVKAAIFLVLAYVLGTLLLPRLFGYVARSGSSELFLLVVFATALLTAFVSSAVFGLSLALGAFVGGVVVSESDLSHQAAAEVTPFRDLFAVLFFVSVGMLVDPAALVAELPLIGVMVAIAVVIKGGLIALLGRAAGLPVRSALLLGGAMAQVGEFSFILAEDARSLGILDPRAYNLILGTAVVSILLTSGARQVAYRLAMRSEGRADRASEARPPPHDEHPEEEATTPDEAPLDRAPARMGAGARWRTERAIEEDDEARRPTIVVLGAGRVGRVVANAVRLRGFRCVVVDRDARNLARLERLGTVNVFGDAANPEILKRLGLERARILIIAVGDPLTARLASERALRINPRLSVASRVRGRREVDGLRQLGVRRLADPEAEAAFELARHALQRMGVSGPELTGIVAGLRRDVYGHDRD
ncbi:MAG: cation:proton antiporter family protein [Chloroflexota bacterium]